VLAALASFDTVYAGAAVLYAFNGGPDGAGPGLYSTDTGLIADSAGNLYGTTYAGGGSGCAGDGCGTVFMLAPDGTETVLYAFRGLSDGENPTSGVIRDTAGNLYGTTVTGGKYGGGTVFKLAPDGTETVLHSFDPESDGEYPNALIRDMSGNIYGTTYDCGIRCDLSACCGTVFELAPNGTETVLHFFTGGSDGSHPQGRLIWDGAGNFYGTTTQDGPGGSGTVFKLAPDGTETVLHGFACDKDGSSPEGTLIRDKAGDFYGTTTYCGAGGGGTAFKLAPNGTLTVLHAFVGGIDGYYPFAGLIQDRAGNLYGTTIGGGDGPACNYSYGCGILFKLAPDGTETVLHTFGRHRHSGSSPYAGLIFAPKGMLIGLAARGGNTSCQHGCGTVFVLKK